MSRLRSQSASAAAQLAAPAIGVVAAFVSGHARTEIHGVARTTVVHVEYTKEFINKIVEIQLLHKLLQVCAQCVVECEQGVRSE